MELIENKTKAMLFNFTRNKQFSTRLTIGNKTIKTVIRTKFGEQLPQIILNGKTILKL